MAQQVVEQLLEVKKTIERAQILQITIDNLENNNLRLIERSIQKHTEEFQSIKKKLSETDNYLNLLDKRITEGNYYPGCLSRLFAFSGLVVGGIIGTSIFPIVGSIIGGILGVILFSKVDDLIQKILNFILPKKIKEKRLKNKVLQGQIRLSKEIENAENKKKYYDKEMSTLLKEASKLSQDKKEILFKIDTLNKELLSIEKPVLLSLEYCEPSIIDCLVQFIESGRADTLKEALNLYEDQLHKEVMIKLQEEQIKLGQKLTEQQEKMLKQQIRQSKQLRYANTLHTINTVRHWSKEGEIRFKK